MPGTHTKWVRISAGEAVSFRTFMTGEMFALMSEQSVLRHSMDDAWDEDAFLAAAREGMANPQALAGRFFSLRAQGLVAVASPGAAKASLSGLLIGAELSAAKPYWLGQRVALLGAASLSSLYETALKGEAVIPERVNVTDATLAGLSAAYEKLKETP
jgi:2-dehydro-3-deoxygalactonokinase